MTRSNSYSSGTSSVPLLGETIGACFERTVAAHPDREALVSCHQGLRFTYRELDDAVNLVARGLLTKGFEVGDRVGIWSPNYAEWTIVQLATAKIGAILVNLNPAYRTHELSYALNQSGCRLLVAAPNFKTSDYRAMVAAVADDLDTVEETIFLFSDEWAALTEVGRGVSPETLVTRSATLQFDDPINIQYTSGTTGFPKGATLSHHNILNNGFFVGVGCRYTEQDRVCIPVPLYHCFGMVMGNLGAITHGATMIPKPPLTRAPRCGRSPPNDAPASTAFPRCSSPSSPTPTSSRPISRRCERA